jgi:hypothetical protein
MERIRNKSSKRSVDFSISASIRANTESSDIRISCYVSVEERLASDDSTTNADYHFAMLDVKKPLTHNKI